VRRHLADLPDDERADLLEDLEDHLTELCAEFDDGLEAHLGTPERYAEELRASAGLADLAPRSRFGALADAVVASRPIVRLRHASRAVQDLPVYGRARHFADELRPGWWVLRGYLLALAAQVVTDAGEYSYPIPRFMGRRSLGLVMVAVAVYASIGLAHRGDRGRRWRLLAVAATVVALIAAVHAGSLIDDAAYQWSHSGGYVEYVYPSDGLYGVNGPITNIYPYTVDGERLENVLLYDQNGNPVEISPYGVSDTEYDLYRYEGGTPTTMGQPYYGYGDPPLTIDDRPVYNLFPLPTPEPFPTLPGD